MSLTDLTLVSTLKSRLQWHQARQRVLAENVANANTPGFQPRDLVQPSATGGAGGLAVSRTNAAHMGATGPGDASRRAGGIEETRPSGNAVSLEDEMLKSAANQSDFQLAASLYQKSLSLLRTAAGVRSGG